jgi:nitrate reductase / nitrite oxidoreductase, beta subunit
LKIKAQVGMVMNLDKCIGCHTCSVTCKNTWTNRPGVEYAWFNSVETKPGTGYPQGWEDQKHWKGGWELRNGKLRLKGGSRLWRLLRIFYNPDLPTLENYYEPFTYDYESLVQSPARRHQPVARPKSAVTGDFMEIRWGPNWEDDLAGSHVTGRRDPNLVGLEKEILFEYEQSFMMYLPRICEHCLNPACVASCPSGAMYKREEDGIVLVDQEQCRAWRFCVSGCPYKKVYFNWKTHKAEKCTFCYPRFESGLTTVCSETCVGRIRYVGIVLYDADRVESAASVEDPKKLYESQLSLFLDPGDPKVAEQARADGVPEDWIEFARRSPIYKLAVKWRLALPLHPQFRTLPMVWYVPPLSPLVSRVKGGEAHATAWDIFPALDQMRIPLQYLANLLTAGDPAPVREALRKMVALRTYMRAVNLGLEPDRRVLAEAGVTPSEARAMYRLLALGRYDERFVIPSSHREVRENAYAEQGMKGLAFAENQAGAAQSFHKLPYTPDTLEAYVCPVASGPSCIGCPSLQPPARRSSPLLQIEPESSGDSFARSA